MSSRTRDSFSDRNLTALFHKCSFFFLKMVNFIYLQSAAISSYLADYKAELMQKIMCFYYTKTNISKIYPRLLEYVISSLSIQCPIQFHYNNISHITSSRVLMPYSNAPFSHRDELISNMWYCDERFKALVGLARFMVVF